MSNAIQGPATFMAYELVSIDQIVEDPFNARRHLTGVDELAVSLEAVGQIVPVIVRPFEGSKYVLLAGHRRVAAARKLGWATIAAVVTSAAPEDREALAGLAENVSRVNLTPSDLADAVGRLVGLDVSDDEIARALTIRPEEVTAARTLAGASTSIRSKAAKLAEAHPLTILQQAALVTYGDVKEDLAKIESTLASRPEQLDHTISEILHRRKRVAAIMAVKAKLGATPILKKFEWSGPPIATEPLVNLLSDKGKQLTLATHKTCPGHAATIEGGTSYYDGPPKAHYWCTDWKANGHALTAKPERTWHGRGQKKAPAAVKKSATEKALEVANDAAWEAAEPVREAFVTQLCQHKLSPEAKLWLLRDVLTVGCDPSGSDVKENLPIDRLYCELLAVQLEDHERRDLYQTWRTHDTDARSYFLFLESEGYALSDVERLILKG